MLDDLVKPLCDSVEVRALRRRRCGSRSTRLREKERQLCGHVVMLDATLQDLYFEPQEVDTPRAHEKRSFRGTRAARKAKPCRR